MIFLIAGYGGITPKSQWGRLGELENEFIASNTIIVSYHSLSAALLYALFGIPIILLYLSTMGEGLASGMRCIFKRLRASSSKRNSSSTSNSTSSSTTTPSSSTSNNNLDETMNNTKKNLVGESRQYGNWNHSSTSSLQKHFHNPSLHGYNNNYLASSMVTGNHHKTEKQSAVPIYICIMILICYVTSGAALFHELQKWGVLESLYFCFTALSTIGFGDLLPKDEMGMYVASAYILVGMAVVAMCFSLIQTELIIWLRKFAIQEQSKDDEIALVNVTITPIKSWHRPNDLLLNDYNSLPRTPRQTVGTSFQRNTPARRSTGILENQMEYFVPRSVSEFNLSGVGDLALGAALPPPRRIQQTIIPLTALNQTSMLKPREKMIKAVTFEDESGMQKCPHGVLTTPRKNVSQIGDVFMWRDDDDYDRDDLSSPLDFESGNVIKV